MASLLALLSQKTPNLQTRKGLILTGLQNDFLAPDGKLPVTSESDHVGNIRSLVPAFREFGDIIWVRSQYEVDRPADDGHGGGDCVIAGDHNEGDSNDPLDEDDEDSPVPLKRARTTSDHDHDASKRPSGLQKEDFCNEPDEELFLTRSTKREPCCIRDTPGMEFADQVRDLIDPKDLQVLKTCYSAFGSTSLLLTLRSKLITELFIGGNMTNLSVLATAMDAARYGIRITLIEDCLGYRTKDRHNRAIAKLKDDMGAELLTSSEVLNLLRDPPQSSDEEYDTEEEEEEIKVGEDAAGMHSDTLQADSDGDAEEQFELPFLVRPPHDSRQQKPFESLSSPLLSTRSPEVEPDEESSRASATRSSGRGLDTEPGRVDYAQRSDARSDNHKDHTKRDGGPRDVSGVNDSSAGGVKIDSAWFKKDGAAYRQRPQSSHPGLAALASLVGLNQDTVDSYEALMKSFHSITMETQIKSGPEGAPLFGPNREDESDGSRILYDLLPAELAHTVFDQLNTEVNWKTMHHQTGEVPRLVSCQGTISEDGSMPVYRHPSDQTLPIEAWTATVDRVRLAAEAVVGHDLNHALIQLYRGGTDFISEHSDKTLDIAKGSSIVNVSFGAQRTMRLRTKRNASSSADSTSSGRTTHRVAMPHNSMITMSLRTNAQYLHGINADKRPRVELIDAEKAFDGQRISLTFRKIATFLDKDSAHIWGQGATGKTQSDAQPVINGDAAESERLVRAFGSENQASSINWDATYGAGFDVLHLK